MAMSRALAGKSVTSRLSMTIAPFVTCSRPAMMRSSVDFPQPDGPTSTRNSPSAMASWISCSTCTLPNDFATLSTSIVAMRALLPDGTSQHDVPPAKRASERPTKFVKYLSRRINGRAATAKKIEQRWRENSCCAVAKALRRVSGPNDKGGLGDGENDHDSPAIRARSRSHCIARRRCDAVSGAIRKERGPARDHPLELALRLRRRGLAEDDRQLQRRPQGQGRADQDGGHPGGAIHHQDSGGRRHGQCSRLR